MNKKIKAVIFDLDGTLLDTLTDLHLSVNATMEHLGYPSHTKEEVRQFVGNGVAKLIQRALPDGKSNPDFEIALDYFKKHYEKHMYDNTAAYEGIYDCLDKLKKNGYRLAVVSNKFDLAVKELCAKYFPLHIEVAIGENEAANVKKKPAPDTVIKALSDLQVTREEAVYVGDSDVDVETAKNSAMPCISVLWGFRSKEFLENSGANVFASNSKELLTRVRDMDRSFA